MSDVFTSTVNRHALCGLSMVELRDLRESMVLTGDVLSGLLCQPRYIRGRSALYNAAGEAIDLVYELVMRIADAIEDEAKGRTLPEGSDDADYRTWLLIRAQAERSGELTAVLELAQREVTA